MPQESPGHEGRVASKGTPCSCTSQESPRVWGQEESVAVAVSCSQPSMLLPALDSAEAFNPESVSGFASRVLSKGSCAGETIASVPCTLGALYWCMDVEGLGPVVMGGEACCMSQTSAL